MVVYDSISGSVWFCYVENMVVIVVTHGCYLMIHML